MPLKIMTSGYADPSFSRNGGRRNAIMSRDELQGAYHQVIILGQYIQGNLVWPELIELASAERARLCAG